MLRFTIRELLILLAPGPPMLAGVWLAWQDHLRQQFIHDIQMQQISKIGESGFVALPMPESRAND